jgi:hypothetical protein
MLCRTASTSSPEHIIEHLKDLEKQLAIRKDMRFQRDGASPSNNPCGERETKSAAIFRPISHL